MDSDSINHDIILLTKTNVVQNEDALSYHRVRGLYFQAVVFEASIVVTVSMLLWTIMYNSTVTLIVLFSRQ